MSADNPTPPPENPGGPRPKDEHGSFSQEVQFSQVTARIPERVGKGVFSTGALVLQGQHEFVIDFLQRMSQPQQVVARVVMAHALMPGLINALRDNLANYQAKFGPPPALPAPPPNATPPSIDEIYAQVKLHEEMFSGVYANAAMIAHTPSEFCFDFITNFYPRSAVSCRVFLSVPQVPPLLGTLMRAYHQYQQHHPPVQPPRPPEPPPAPANN